MHKHVAILGRVSADWSSRRGCRRRSRDWAMFEENVEVRRGLIAYKQSDVNAFADLTTADFEWFPAVTGAVEGNSWPRRSTIPMRR